MAEKNKKTSLVFCSFCGRHSDFVKKLAAGVEHDGKTSYICDNCAKIAVELMGKGDSK